MTYLPADIMKNILSYCDDRIERKQKRLWNSIKARKTREPTAMYNGHRIDKWTESQFMVETETHLEIIDYTTFFTENGELEGSSINHTTHYWSDYNSDGDSMYDSDEELDSDELLVYDIDGNICNSNSDSDDELDPDELLVYDIDGNII